MSIKTARRTILVALIVLSFALSAGTAMALSVGKGDMAPDFTLNNLDDKPVKLSDGRGKVVLLAFWASWCPRCMDELAFLQELYAEHKDEMVVIAVNQDTKNLSKTHLEKLKVDIAKMKLGYEVLLDLKFEAWQQYGINALPTSVIIDREGKIVYVEPNYYWASQKKIKGVLKELGLGVE